MTLVYIGLGSNLSNANGDSKQILQQAVQALQTLATDSVRVSGLYASRPMGPQDQPDYLNAVAVFNTHMLAPDLLLALQSIEQQAGRVRLRHWGERTLDLDLLLYGKQTIDTATLSVPHKGIFERSFVLIPLLDLDKQLEIDGVLLKNCTASQPSTQIWQIADSMWFIPEQS